MDADAVESAPRMVLDLGSTVVGVDIEDQPTADTVAVAFASLATAHDPTVLVCIERRADRHVLRIDGEDVADSSEPTTLVDHLVSWMNREAVVAAHPDLVNLHAAAMVHPATGRLVLVPGSPGAGKSTAAATAAAAGWGYLSDELVAIDGAGMARPHPKPITIKAGGTAVVDIDMARWSSGPQQRRWYLPAPALGGYVHMGPARPHAVLATRYAADADASWTPLSCAETLLELAANTQDELDPDGRILERLGRLAAGVVGVRGTTRTPGDVLGHLSACAEAEATPTRDPVAAIASSTDDSGPAATPGVVSIDCGDGGLLHHPTSAALVVLDAPGMVIWRLLDGSADIDVIARDLADAFHRPVEQMRSDVGDLLVRLRAEGVVTEA